MLPIDHDENSRRILATGQYQIPNSRGKEDKWLFSYLKANGVAKEEAYKIWLPIFNTRNFCYSGSVIASAIFDDIWSIAKKSSLTPRYSKIVFYKEEIDFLKSLPIKRWQKEFFMMTYGILKARGTKEIARLPLSDVLPWTSLPMRHGMEGPEVEDAGSKNDVFCHLTETKWDYTFGGYENYDVYVFTGIRCLGDPVIECDSILDVPNYFEDLFGIRVCARCGKVFGVSTKSKTDLCSECYNAERELEQAYIKKKFFEMNVKKEETPCVCGQCGKQFIKSSKSKTDLCGECWKTKEKNRIREAVRKHRADNM